MSVRVYCIKCGYVGRIESSSQEAETVKRLYCCCTNPECGHSWAMELSFSHTLSPSALDLPEQLRQKIRKAGPAEQMHLFTEMGEGFGKM
ncbi:ogr/Delta-like zinc finger family protein [Maridesulfovibrio zosterae]|uniref:ogr/Delta-like zinc finger family protein n=1 Tax=Maridesulfovibrio zosterae TaxID=82171 RepID=UPI00048867F1|nr:ogr/Delta-like zinc finger family protein [Maridesulfovibrio zosterae]